MAKNNENKGKGFSGKLVFFIYLLVWAISVGYYWITGPTKVGASYSILAFYLALPITTFLVSFIAGRFGLWGFLRILSPVFFAVAFMGATYLTFGVANYLESHVINPIDMEEYIALGVGGLLSLGGLIIGGMGRLSSNRAKKKHQKELEATKAQAAADAKAELEAKAKEAAKALEEESK